MTNNYLNHFLNQLPDMPAPLYLAYKEQATAILKAHGKALKTIVVTAPKETIQQQLKNERQALKNDLERLRKQALLS